MERVLFYLPEGAEATLAALSTIQEFVKFQRHMAEKHRDKFELELFMHPRNHCLAHLVTICDAEDVRIHLINEFSTSYRGSYDLVFDFNEEEAYRIGYPTRRHIVQVFGLQLGLDPKILPDMKAWPKTKESIDVLVLPGLYSMCAFEVARQNGWSVEMSDSLDSSEEFRLLLRSRMVVGQRSGATYLACALDKKVVEFYPADKHRRWLSKWSHPWYAMIYGDAIRYQDVKSAMEDVWARPDFRQEFKTTTEQQRSIAASAAEQSPEG